MTIYEYTAINNPNGARNLLGSYGVKPINRPDYLAKQLADLISRTGNDGLYKLGSIHPDFELVKKIVQGQVEKEYKEKESEKEKSFLNADGQEIKDTVKEIKAKQEVMGYGNGSNSPNINSDKTELMIIGSIALIGLALILNRK